MGLWLNRILPRMTEKMCSGDELYPLRKEVLASAGGRVLELGFGSGLNLPHYPEHVESLVAVDVNQGMNALATSRLAESAIKVEMRMSDGFKIPAEDEGFDCVVCTFTLCSVDSVETSLREMRRVLKPNGKLMILEHGLSNEPEVQRLQRLVNPLTRTIGGNCHLTRDIAKNVSDGGFSFERVRNFYVSRKPKTFGFITLGTAIKVDAPRRAQP